MLAGVNVALGITGSVAAVRTVELVHELRRRGATVHPVMTPAATNIIHPWAVGFGAETEPVTEITGSVEHVEYCGRDGWADVLLIAPATANTLGKIAAGIDDTPVTTMATTAIGAGLPVVIAPAMHEPMYDHPGVLDAIETLESWDIAFVEPRIEEQKAKIATIDAIATTTARHVGDRPLADTHITITAGATAEAIDPVRVLTNRASGRTGRALARACYVQGADVTLVHGPIGMQSLADAGLDTRSDDPAMPFLDVVSVESAAEMRTAVMDILPETDLFISTAAISDYTTDRAPDKLASGPERTLSLRPTPKLLDQVREQRPELPIVGFKTESTTDEAALVEAARHTMDRADLACVIANDASVMGATDTAVLFVTEDSMTEIAGDKQRVGTRIAQQLPQAISTIG